MNQVRPQLDAPLRLFCSESFCTPDISAALEAENIERRAAETLLNGSPSADWAVLVLDRALLARGLDPLRLPDNIEIVAADAEAERARYSATLSIADVPGVSGRLAVLRAGFQLLEARRQARDTARQMKDLQQEISGLNRVGLALMVERDGDHLLELILDLAKRLTESDAAAVILVEHDDSGVPVLRPRRVVADSLPDLPPLQGETWPIDDTSMIGHVARTGKPMVVEDSYALTADSQFVLNVRFDRRHGYYRKPLLILPMIDHRGEVVGVLQLANRKSCPEARITNKEAADRYTLPYTDREVQIGLSMAGQAAVSIENFRLYAQIEQLFECFVKAAATAIDQRDPATAGHSTRVATLAVDLANAVDRTTVGNYRDVRFTNAQLRELRFAALLHDFGKVGVREEVLVKEAKLPRYLWERVSARFELIRCLIELDFQRRLAALPDAERQRAAPGLEAELQQALAAVDACQAVVRRANEPTLLSAPERDELQDVAQRTCPGRHGTPLPYLMPEELHYLQIPEGNLDEHERLEVESHAEKTREFLSEIPWTSDLLHLPSYAADHHEKLNGSGYPQRRTGADIPIQTRIITIADIFDALTESDRPYRSAVDVDQALAILQAEADAGTLDRDLVQVFIESKAYRRALESG